MTNYEAVKHICFKDLSDLQRMFCIWFVVSLVGLVFLIINLILYSQQDTIVLIAFIKSISGIQNTTNSSGFVMIPIGAFVMISLIPFLCGRCLSIAATVSFTKKLCYAIKVNGSLFIALAVFAIIIDYVNYRGASKAGFAYFLVFVLHALIAATACYLMYLTYLKAVQLA